MKIEEIELESKKGVEVKRKRQRERVRYRGWRLEIVEYEYLSMAEGECWELREGDCTRYSLSTRLITKRFIFNPVQKKTIAT